MAKDPCVLFYTQDFLVGTATFSKAMKGHYIDLLCFQQQSKTGSLSEQEIKTIMGKDYNKLWPSLAPKFDKDENGFYNERMRFEIERRKKNSEKQKDRVDKRWHNHGNTAVDTTVLHTLGNTFLEIETEIESCLEIALRDERWTRANMATRKELIDFNRVLEKRGHYKRNPKDYKSHFANWKRGGKKEEVTQEASSSPLLKNYQRHD